MSNPRKNFSYGGKCFPYKRVQSQHAIAERLGMWLIEHKIDGNFSVRAGRSDGRNCTILRGVHTNCYVVSQTEGPYFNHSQSVLNQVMADPGLADGSSQLHDTQSVPDLTDT